MGLVSGGLRKGKAEVDVLRFGDCFDGAWAAPGWTLLAGDVRQHSHFGRQAGNASRPRASPQPGSSSPADVPKRNHSVFMLKCMFSCLQTVAQKSNNPGVHQLMGEK